jgi:hypothetical protein
MEESHTQMVSYARVLRVPLRWQLFWQSKEADGRHVLLRSSTLTTTHADSGREACMHGWCMCGPAQETGCRLLLLLVVGFSRAEHARSAPVQFRFPSTVTILTHVGQGPFRMSAATVPTPLLHFAVGFPSCAESPFWLWLFFLILLLIIRIYITRL